MTGMSSDNTPISVSYFKTTFRNIQEAILACVLKGSYGGRVEDHKTKFNVKVNYHHHHHMRLTYLNM